MLRRNGELVQNEIPGFDARLSDAELASYNAAFATIEREYQQIKKGEVTVATAWQGELGKA